MVRIAETIRRQGNQHLLTPLAAALMGAAIWLAAGCHSQSPPESPLPELSGPTMGTRYHIRLAKVPAGTSLGTLRARVDKTLETVDAQMSTWRDDSEISRFNAHGGDDWFSVSPETAAVVHEAQRISRLTKGLFDITVTPLVDLWQFGPQSHGTELPTDAQIATALQHVGYEKLAVNLDPPALRKSHPDLQVDLSAIAKGFGVDQVSQTLGAAGVRGFLVEIGGEIRTHGVRPDTTAWQVGIEKPVELQRSVHFILPLLQRSLATSGDYRNYYEVDGSKFSHTIDPRTGRPAVSQLASVSVVHESCMTADALATAMMVLGAEEAYNFAVEHEIAALLLVRDAERFLERRTPAFEDYIAEASLHSPPAAIDQPTDSMTTFLAALVIVGIAVVGMAIGVIVGNRRLRGTCGGLSSMRDSEGRTICDACTAPREDCGGIPQSKPAQTGHTPAESETQR